MGGKRREIKKEEKGKRVGKESYSSSVCLNRKKKKKKDVNYFTLLSF